MVISLEGTVRRRGSVEAEEKRSRIGRSPAQMSFPARIDISFKVQGTKLRYRRCVKFFGYILPPSQQHLVSSSLHSLTFFPREWSPLYLPRRLVFAVLPLVFNTSPPVPRLPVSLVILTN